MSQHDTLEVKTFKVLKLFSEIVIIFLHCIKREHVEKRESRSNIKHFQLWNFNRRITIAKCSTDFIIKTSI